MSEEPLVCPICGRENPHDRTRCKICGSSLGVMDAQDKSILKALKHISGVGSYKAKKIVDSGITSLDKLESADLNSFLRVDGIGESTAKEIMEAIEGSKKDEGGLYLCGECGAFVGKQASTCYNCGTKMEDDTEEDTGDDIEIEEFVDSELEEKEEGSLYLCGNCGSFISDNNTRCPYCNTALEDDEELEDMSDDFIEDSLIDRDESTVEEVEEDEGGLYLCTNCGSFVSASSDVCTLCGFSFLEDEEKDTHREEIADDVIDDLIRESEKELQPETSLSGTEKELLTEELEVDGSDIEEDWLTDDLEVDESDIEELDREIESALEVEYGVSANTIKALSLGGDIKLCGNCGRICEEKESVCSLCGHEFGEISETTIEPDIAIHEEDMSQVTDTMLKALGISELSDTEVTEEEHSVNICTVCGAFCREGSDRCPICGSLFSEAPEIDIIEDMDESIYSDDKLYMCDACGAMVSGGQKTCSICGSNLEVARRKIEEETLDTEEDKTGEIVSAFFGDYEGIEVDEKAVEQDITFCDVCGALVVKGEDKCSICRSSISEEPKEDITGAEYYFGMDEVTDQDISQIEDEIDLELVEEQEDIGELLSKIEDQDYFEELDTITKQLESNEDISNEDFESDSEIDESELMDDLVEKELEIEETDENITEDQLISEPDIIDELVEKELQLDDDITEIEDKDDEELMEILDNISNNSITVIDEQDDDLEDFDVGAVLEEISEEITEKQQDEMIYDAPEEESDDEWTRCPSCDSYVDIDSDVCGVCDHSFSDTLEEESITTSSTVEPLTSSESHSEEVDADWIEDIINEPVKVKTTKKPERYKPPSMIKGTFDRIKEYEVPISGISLLAFGGLSMYSYGDYGLRYLMSIGLIIIGIFMGIGLITLILLRNEYMKDSVYGLMGYLVGLGMAAFVPMNICFLNVSIPLVANVGMLGAALGMFWVLDFKIHPAYRYYILWFFGIILIFIVLSSSLMSGISSYDGLGYPIIMSMGLGSVLVFGSTLSWYKQVSSDTQAYESMRTGHRHLIYGDYEDALVNLEKADTITSKKGSNDSEKNSQLQYSKGLALCSMGLYENAVETFRDVLKNDPDNVCAWNNLGTAYSRMGEQKKAIMCFKHALNGDPTYEISWNNLGNALYRSGEYSKALDCYDKALELNSSYRDANINKSQALIKLGQQGSQIV